MGKRQRKPKPADLDVDVDVIPIPKRPCEKIRKVITDNGDEAGVNPIPSSGKGGNLDPIVSSMSRSKHSDGSIVLEDPIEFRYMQIGTFLFPLACICLINCFRYCIP